METEANYFLTVLLQDCGVVRVTLQSNPVGIVQSPR